MHRTDEYSQHSSIIWRVWLNRWVFIYELSGCGLQSSCSHYLWLIYINLNFQRLIFFLKKDQKFQILDQQVRRKFQFPVHSVEFFNALYLWLYIFPSRTIKLLRHSSFLLEFKDCLVQSDYIKSRRTTWKTRESIEYIMIIILIIIIMTIIIITIITITIIIIIFFLKTIE